MHISVYERGEAERKGAGQLWVEGRQEKERSRGTEGSKEGSKEGRGGERR